MRVWHFAVVSIGLVLIGCAKAPESAPPEQRAAGQAGAAAPAVIRESSIAMNAPEADAAVMQDVLNRAGDTPWRWTNQHPRVRLFVGDTAGQKLRVEFTVADATFKQTGPISVTWVVNGKDLATVRYAEPGSQVFEKPVPPDMLRANSENIAGADIDKVFVSPSDGVKLGLILSRIAFVK